MDENTRQSRVIPGDMSSAHKQPESVATMARRYRQQRRKRSRKAAVLRLVLFSLAICVVLSGGTLGAGYYYYMNYIHPSLANFERPVSRNRGEAPTSVYTGSIQGRAWNILLLGSDNDDKFTFPVILTQVMMVVHIDPIKNNVTMVSIPRDSWVNVPDMGMHKIDQSFLLGAQQENSFEGGVRLARETIEHDYGITIDRYAWVGLNGFSKVIDTLGGVDVDVIHPVVDDSYPDDTGHVSDVSNPYGYRRIYIPAGPQHFNGEEALQYVRSRHSDQIGDIGRTQRQQQVLEALKHKLDLSHVINNMTQLLQDLKGQIYTDLSEQEMLGFANYGRSLNGQDIKHVTLGPGDAAANNYGQLASIYDPWIGAFQDVVLPDCNAIQPAMNGIFDLGTQESCNVTG